MAEVYTIIWVYCNYRVDLQTQHYAGKFINEDICRNVGVFFCEMRYKIKDLSFRKL